MLAEQNSPLPRRPAQGLKWSISFVLTSGTEALFTIDANKTGSLACTKARKGQGLRVVVLIDRPFISRSCLLHFLVSSVLSGLKIMSPGRTFNKSAIYAIFGQEWLQRASGGAILGWGVGCRERGPGLSECDPTAARWDALEIKHHRITPTRSHATGTDRDESSLACEGDSDVVAGYWVWKPVPPCASWCGETSERLVPGPDRATGGLVKMEKTSEK